MTTTNKMASLTAGLVARKGEAAPASVTTASTPVAPSVAVVPAPAKPKPAEEPAVNYYKKLSVKLDRERYVALKRIGTDLDKNSQEILTQALDDWLAKRQKNG